MKRLVTFLRQVFAFLTLVAVVNTATANSGGTSNVKFDVEYFNGLVRKNASTVDFIMSSANVRAQIVEQGLAAVSISVDDTLKGLQALQHLGQISNSGLFETRRETLFTTQDAYSLSISNRNSYPDLVAMLDVTKDYGIGIVLSVAPIAERVRYIDQIAKTLSNLRNSNAQIANSQFEYLRLYAQREADSYIEDTGVEPSNPRAQAFVLRSMKRFSDSIQLSFIVGDRKAYDFLKQLLVFELWSPKDAQIVEGLLFKLANDDNMLRDGAYSHLVSELSQTNTLHERVTKAAKQILKRLQKPHWQLSCKDSLIVSPPVLN